MDEKIKTWFKKNWLFITIICIVGVCFYLTYRQFSFYGDYTDLLNNKYSEQSESFKKQLKEIEKINNDWRTKQEKLNNDYLLKIKSLEESYEENLKIINKNQKNNQKKIIQEAKKDPTTLTKKIEETFGIPVYNK